MSPRAFKFLCLFALIFIACTQGTAPQLEKEEKAAKELKSSHMDLANVIADVANFFNEETEFEINNKNFLEAFEHVNSRLAHPLCPACKGFMKTAKRITNSKIVVRTVEEIVKDACIISKKVKPLLCKQAIKTFGEVVIHSLSAKIFNPERACARLRLCPKTWETEILGDYIQEVLKDKPNTPQPTPTKRNTYKMMHISDLHVDLEYQVGSNAQCDYFQCCRNASGKAPNATAAAQWWGTISDGCDIPLRTIEQFAQYVKNNFEIDMILWTGDNTAHDVLTQNPTMQINNTLQITQVIKKYFNTEAIYAIHGNHEAYPVNVMDYYDNSSFWLSSQLSDLWKGWLDEETYNTFRQKGFYGQVDKKHNVRVIAVDTNACNNLNFDLYQNPTDPYGQLAYIRDQLYQAEKANQSVFIIGHIPPGSGDCVPAWSARYNALVDRFSHIIRGQFFGHTHNDHFEVTHSFLDNSAVSTVFITPSLTTRSFLYPSFRIYEVDADTNVLVNYYQYHLDLDKWNKNTTGPLQWELFYSFLELYNAPDMSPATFDALADKLMADPKLMSRYLWNKKSGYGKMPTPSISQTWHAYCAAKVSLFSEVVDCLGEYATADDLKTLKNDGSFGEWYYYKNK